MVVRLLEIGDTPPEAPDQRLDRPTNGRRTPRVGGYIWFLRSFCLSSFPLFLFHASGKTR